MCMSSCRQNILHISDISYYFFSSQIISSPLPPVSSPPPASKTKEGSDGENLEVSTELFKFPIGEILPDKHFMFAFKTLILINKLNITTLLNNLFYDACL